MNIMTLLDAVYGVITADTPAGVTKIFQPGKPVGPFAQNMPAVVINPEVPSKTMTPIARDIKETGLNVTIHVFTEDVYSRQEVRSRGDLTELSSIIEAIEGLLEADPTLGDIVDDLLSLETSYYSPAHAWITARYQTREERR